MRYFPIFIDTEVCSVYFIGGTEAVSAKVRLLAKSQAKIVVIAEAFVDELIVLADKGRIELIKEAPDVNLLSNDPIDLLYLDMTDEAQIATWVSAATTNGIWINVIDKQRYCKYITPAMIDRGPITIAIGSEGKAPTLARMIKSRIETLLPAHLGSVVETLSLKKQAVNQAIRDMRKRRLFWQTLYQEVLTLPSVVRIDERFNALFKCFQQHEDMEDGQVVIVGAVPGYAQMLTLEAVQALQNADVIFYDYLVDEQVIDYARREARLVKVDNTSSKSSMSQDDINTCVITDAKSGDNVVRLINGDAMTFYSSDNQIKAFKSANIRFRIVPGVSPHALVRY